MNTWTEQSHDAGRTMTDSVDQMLRWPMWMTGATIDLAMQSMQRMAAPFGWMIGDRSRYSAASGSCATTEEYSSGVSSGASASRSTPSWMSMFSGGSDQNLGGNDLKYV